MQKHLASSQAQAVPHAPVLDHRQSRAGLVTRCLSGAWQGRSTWGIGVGLLLLLVAWESATNRQITLIDAFGRFTGHPAKIRNNAVRAVDYVNPLIGSAVPEDPNRSGGMIPSVAPPFGMTRWVAQTTDHYISATPYNWFKSSIRGFVGTHQPAIWMGESGHATLVPGLGAVKPHFRDRGMNFSHSAETATLSHYSVDLESHDGYISVNMTATSRVGYFRFTFSPAHASVTPWILLQSSRAYLVHGWVADSSLAYPLGCVHIDADAREVSGLNRERQDDLYGPSRAPNFAGYFVARFDTAFESFGVAVGCNKPTFYEGSIAMNETSCLSGYVRFPVQTREVQVRVGVSFISVEQARRNLDAEIPDGQSFERTAQGTEAAWAEKLNRLEVEGGSEGDRTVFYTAAYHSLQYPYEQHEDGRYYSAYTDSVHSGISYTGYSIWDTFRAAWAWQILLAPERINGMITSMLQNYQQGGWLPMWLNLAETNIMIGTHADSLIAEALVKGFRGFDTALAYEALIKDATVPPEGDDHIVYSDRQEGVGYEVRAGLSSVYAERGWVANDVHSESASRTLDYAYDDHAVAVAASVLGHSDDATFFAARSRRAVASIFDNSTGFMRARNADGTWAEEDAGWTEGDKWAYTFDVVQDIPQLAELKGGNASLIAFLDEHFDGGHNDHTNEPSHAIPYIYSMVGVPSKTQARVRSIANTNYNATATGLPGNEDCGQMSAWYLFSSLGFYPVDPVSGHYIIGAPLFNKITVHLPNSSTPLVVEAAGTGSGKQLFSRSVTINGRSLLHPVLRHEDIAQGGKLVFEMTQEERPWY